jgi:hypothetical protein
MVVLSTKTGHFPPSIRMRYHLSPPWTACHSRCIDLLRDTSGLVNFGSRALQHHPRDLLLSCLLRSIRFRPGNRNAETTLSSQESTNLLAWESILRLTCTCAPGTDLEALMVVLRRYIVRKWTGLVGGQSRFISSGLKLVLRWLVHRLGVREGEWGRFVGVYGGLRRHIALDAARAKRRLYTCTPCNQYSWMGVQRCHKNMNMWFIRSHHLRSNWDHRPLCWLELRQHPASVHVGEAIVRALNLATRIPLEANGIAR